jgi:hypothetical protein
MEHRMRIGTLVAVSLLAVAAAPPARASAQISINVAFGTRLGPEIGVTAYSTERHGDWRANYRQWTPVTLYDINGHYYRNSVAGARAVVVYSYKDEYFFPPQDQGWNGLDKRYNYERKPIDADYGRVVVAAPHVAISAKFGTEIGVFGYSADRAGDWHANYRHWTPVTLYEVNGHYYPKSGPGSRAVAMYRYKDEYFLPPSDEKWINADKRFDYDHRPNQDDRARVRERP